MIAATGYLQIESDNPARAKRSVVRRQGQLTGDPDAIELLRLEAFVRRGEGIMWHGPVADWIADPVAFGVLLNFVFEGDTLIVDSDEVMAPPPCPEDAVC